MYIALKLLSLDLNNLSKMFLHISNINMDHKSSIRKETSFLKLPVRGKQAL